MGEQDGVEVSRPSNVTSVFWETSQTLYCAHKALFSHLALTWTVRLTLQLIVILETLNPGTLEEFSLKPAGSQLCIPNLFSILISGTLRDPADSHILVFLSYILTTASLLSCIPTTFVFFLYEKLTYLYVHMNSEFTESLHPL